MKKLLLLFWASGSLYAQTTATRQEPKPYHPPLPDQPPAIIVKPKDAPILPLNVANSGFTGISPTASPEVAQMNSLQDMPVNKYTGTPFIKIPLYTLQEAGMGVSLSMNYNASGIRGHQLSGWSGLGWDLEGSIPMVTRMVRGLPDEGKLEMTSWNSSTGRKGYKGNGYIGATGSEDDKEPDYFFFNVGGASYKFIFNPYGQGFFFPDSDIIVSTAMSSYEGSSVVNQFTSFTFNMSDGTTYEFTSSNTERTAEVEVGFAQTNQVYPFPNNVNSPNFAHYLKTNSVTSAWYCTKITSPQGHQINFTYNKVLYSYYKLADNEASVSCPGIVDKKINRVFVQGASIKTIETRHTVVKFNDGYTSCITIPDPVTLQPREYCFTLDIPNRQDIDDWTQNPSNSSAAKLLKNIVVYDKNHVNEKMTWSFDYDYFTGTDNSGFDLPNGYSYSGTNPVGHTHKKRLKLTSIHYPDGNHSDFSYYGEESGFNFKTRFTYGVDHWGYINGADGNINGMGLIATDQLSPVCGSNRDTNIDFLRYGSLTKVKHSAGSEVFLTYEAHRASNYGSGNINIGGLRIKQMRTKDLLRGTEIQKEYSYLASDGLASSGFLFIKPIYRFDDNNANRFCNSALYELMTSESSRPSIGYSRVTETVYDVTNTIQTGKTISYYDQDKTELGLATSTQYCYTDPSTQVYTCIPVTGYFLDSFIPAYDFRAGSLLKEETYNQATQLLSVVEMSYTPNNGIASDSTYCRRVMRLNGVTNQNKYYYLKIKKYRLEQVVSKNYSEDGSGTPQTNTVAYTYKDEMPQAYKNTYQGRHNQVVKTTTTDSYGYLVEQSNKYIADFSFDIDSTLMCYTDCAPCSDAICQYWNVTMHVPPVGSEARGIYDLTYFMRGMPVESFTKRNGKVISSSYQTYKNGLPVSSYLLRTVPKVNFTEVVFQKTGNQMVKDGAYGTARSEILAYNSLGLPTLVEIKRGTKSRIQYDTQQVLPISQIQNAGVNDSLVTRYDYQKPHLGIAKQTSPNLLELRYNYRSTDGRLDNIQNKEAQILKKYSYQSTTSTLSSLSWDDSRRTKLCTGGQVTLSVYLNGIATGATVQFSTDGGSTWHSANVGTDGYSVTITPTNNYLTFQARASNNVNNSISTQYHGSCSSIPPFNWSANSCGNVGGVCHFFVSVSGLATDSYAEFSTDNTNWYRANVGSNGYNVSIPYGSGGLQGFNARPADNPGQVINGFLTKCQ